MDIIQLPVIFNFADAWTHFVSKHNLSDIYVDLDIIEISEYVHVTVVIALGVFKSSSNLGLSANWGLRTTITSVRRRWRSFTE